MTLRACCTSVVFISILISGHALNTTSSPATVTAAFGLSTPLSTTALLKSDGRNSDTVNSTVTGNLTNNSSTNSTTDDAQAVTVAGATNTTYVTSVITNSTEGTPSANNTSSDTNKTTGNSSVTTPPPTTTYTATTVTTTPAPTTTSPPTTTQAPRPSLRKPNLTETKVTTTTISVRCGRIAHDVQFNVTLVLALRNEKSLKFDTSIAEHTFSGLDPYKQYTVEAYEEWNSEKGPVDEVSIKTEQDVPSAPLNLKPGSVNSDFIELQWEPPKDLNGEIRGGRIFYTYLEEGMKDSVNVTKSKEILANDRSFKLSGLFPFVEYKIRVQEKTDAGFGPNSTTTVKTKKSAPFGPPSGLDIPKGKVNETSPADQAAMVQQNIWWNALPRHKWGDQKIWYEISNLSTVPRRVENVMVDDNVEVTFHLKAYQDYHVSVIAVNTIGKSNATTKNFKTAEASPSAPRDVQLNVIRSPNKRHHSINVTWTQPKFLNGEPRKARLYVWKASQQRTKRSKDPVRRVLVDLDDDSPRRGLIDDLAAYTDYSIQVEEETCAHCFGLKSEPKDIRTKSGVPSVPRDLWKKEIASDSIEIKWLPPSQPRGIIDKYKLVLKNEETKDLTTRQIPSPTGKTAFFYKFVDLEGETGYNIKVAAVNKDGIQGNYATITTITKQSTTWLFILIGCLVVVLIIVLILSIYLLIARRRRPYEEVRPTEDMELRPGVKSKVILVSNFKNYCVQQHANSDHGFQQEYETLRPPVRQFTWEHSLMSYNQVKNRYSNIVAYDHTRVVLAAIEDDPSSTYINANFINGYSREKQFIATQGPLPETIIDFWRMVWDQNCPIIVMLTKLVEDNRLKCEQYWPEGKAMQYRDIVVTITSVKEMTDMTIKVFKLHKINNPELGTKEVQHFHYTAWPDHGVPSHPTSMLSFIRHVMSYDDDPPKGPIIVHCSAGVGRTGTFIAIEGCLRQMENDNQVDVFGTVLQMRMQRNFMVQTESQYIFIYDALLDNAICGNTEISPETLVGRIKYLNENDADSGQSRFISEFRRLESGFTLRDKDQVNDASHPENKAKNRFLNILPYDKNRIRLTPIPGVRNSDYINASIIDGFQQKHAFIATQAPLENTVVDFWRMVLEQNVKIIVMLTKIEEKGQEKCYLYWPQAGTVSYGSIHVEVMNVRNQDDVYTIHDLRLTNRDTGKSWPVTHFLYMGWPEYQGSPDNGTDLINFIGTVEKTQKSVSDAGPTLVHCSGGVGRTGVFITVFNSVEMLKSKNVVDVFQTTRNLRLQRSAMVQTIDQYKFCYQCLKDYLDSFDMYRHPEC